MKKRWTPWVLGGVTVLWLAFIHLRSLQPAVDSHQESVWALELLRRVLPGISLHLVRKLAHFTEFGILGLLLCLDWRCWGRGPVLLPLGAGLAAAGVDELLQTFVPGRSGQISDVLLDFSGVTAGVLLCLLTRRWARIWREKRRHGRDQG